MSSPAPIRISKLTGKPVRKYVRKQKPVVITPQPVKQYDNFFQVSEMKRVNSMKLTEMFTNVKSEFKPLYILRYPTGNCQMCTIGYFKYLILKSTDLTKQLKEIGKNIKPLLLVDFRQDLKEKLYSKINKNAIISESDYISSNNSKMCTMIINTKKL
jgi:PHD/YefM family antitoxin component YafN of YafNO toxin-antitoxin module